MESTLREQLTQDVSQLTTIVDALTSVRLTLNISRNYECVPWAYPERIIVLTDYDTTRSTQIMQTSPMITLTNTSAY